MPCAPCVVIVFIYFQIFVDHIEPPSKIQLYIPNYLVHCLAMQFMLDSLLAHIFLTSQVETLKAAWKHGTSYDRDSAICVKIIQKLFNDG